MVPFHSALGGTGTHAHKQSKEMAIAISQEAFDSMVRENMEDLGMDPDEALADAVEALTLQGADLSGKHSSSDPPLDVLCTLAIFTQTLAASSRDH